LGLSEDARVRQLLSLAHALHRERISHAVIGGVAVAVWAGERKVDDLDIVVTSGVLQGRRTPQRLARVAAAYAVPGEVPPFIPDARDLRTGGEIGIETVLGHLDVIGASLPDEVDRDMIVRRAVTRTVHGWRIRVCRLEDLVAIKSRTGRPKDSLDVALLEAASRSHSS
jgi:hypothetical protein